MNLIVVTPPATQPVTLEEAYAHLHDPPEQHARILSLIISATTDAENITGRAFIEQTLLLTGQRVLNHVVLLRPPVIEIEEASYYDLSNVSTAIDDSYYYLTAGYMPTLRFAEDFSYPSVYSRHDAFRIRYRAGYITDESPPEPNVPEPIKQAILLGVELHYGGMTPQEREALEKARNALLAPYVVHAIA